MGWGAIGLSCVSGDPPPIASISPPGSTPTGDTATPPATCATAEAELQVGTGVDTFQLLEDLDEVELVFGPQGGYHITIAVRACHMASPLTLHIEIFDELSSVAVSDVGYLAATLDVGDCCGERVDMPGFLDTSAVPGIGDQDPGSYLDGKEVSIVLSATDELGNEASDTVQVIARSLSR
ncbi:MAG TPA: hypothetical protein ENK18_13015 [Deltaproteobacteria bacterium]|nr:hypothetical protein [Deltaproteobacteria bacterium]